MTRPLSILIALSVAVLFLAAAPAGACAADEGCLEDQDLIRVEGRVWADWNNNGAIDADEDRPGGTVVYADQDFDGDRDQSEPWASVTGSRGEYVLELRDTDLPPAGGKLPVTLEDLHANTTCTAPESCTYYETLAAGERVTGRDFGVGTGGMIYGELWDDVDADGVREQGEPPLAGTRVFVDDDRDGQVDAGEPVSERSNLAGQYRIDVVPRYVGKPMPPIRMERQRGRACTGKTTCPVTDVVLAGRDGRGKRIDFGVHRPLIIFIHGYGGAEIACRNDMLWIRALSGAPEFDEMRFDRNGTGPLKQSDGGTACSERAGINGNLVEDVGGTDIYGSAAAHYASLVEKDRYASYVWDFRRSPKDAVQGLDELVNRLRCGGSSQTCEQVRSEKVVLVGHSQGGLVAKQYLAAGYRARKVSRFVAIGSPFWGSPKAIFPLYAGIETPLFSELDPIFDNDDLRAMARTLPGHHSLLPSHGYGDFLTIPEMRADGPLDADGVEEFLRRIGSNPALYTDQLVEHINVYDHFEDHGVDVQLVVGEGLPTIGRVRIETGVEPWVESHLVSGDETVPAFSSAHDAPADRVHYVCGASHIPLTAHPQTTALIDEWLVTGEKIKDPPRNCPLTGVRIHVYSPDTASPLGAAASASGGLSLAEADKAGMVDVMRFGKQTTITARSIDEALALGSLKGATVSVTSLRGGKEGPEQRFGPLTGPVSVSGSAGGGLVVRQGAKIAKPARKADTKAPRTAVVLKRGKVTLKVRDASKVAASYLVLGTKRKAYKRPVKLSRRDLKRVKVASVDVWGNAEVPHR